MLNYLGLGYFKTYLRLDTAVALPEFPSQPVQGRENP